MIGNSGRPRIFAFILDNLLATLAAFLAVAALKSDNSYIAGSALCLTYLGYFFISEALWSRTPGKYLQGLVVVDPSGGRCGWRRALLRTLLRAPKDAAKNSRGEPSHPRRPAGGDNHPRVGTQPEAGDLAAGTLVVSAK